MVFSKFKILQILFNRIKLQDVIIFHINERKKSIYTEEIIYGNPEIRDIKIDIIQYYLKRLKLNRSYRNHLFNYLYQVDPKIYKMACLIKYISDKRQKVDVISAQFLTKEDLTIFQQFNLKIEKIKQLKIKIKPNLNLIPMILSLRNKKKQYKKLKEVFSNEKSKLNPEIKYNVMLRAKMKHFENVYLNKLDKSSDSTIIYLDPSLTSLTFRQKEYIKYLKQNKRDFFFYIPKINYYQSFKAGLRICFSFLPKEFKISMFRVLIQRKEIDDLIKKIKKYFPNIEEFYTGNKIYSGATYLNEKLSELRIKTINFSHGLGLACPYVNYDIFYVFSKMQRNYYIGTSTFKYFISKLSKMRKENLINKKLALFFIGQTLLSDTSLKLTSIYEKVISFVEKITLDLKIPTYVKYHPGSTTKDKILSNKIVIVDKIEDLPLDYNYLAVTLYSTYVVELLNLMPFMIINPQEKMNMKYYFPNNDSIYAKTYQEFKDKVNKLMKDTNYYLEYWNKIISQY